MSRRKQSNPRHLDGENENRKFVCLFVCPALTLSFVLLFFPYVIFVFLFVWGFVLFFWFIFNLCFAVFVFVFLFPVSGFIKSSSSW